MQEMKPIKEGKVREIYDNGDSLIMVATDRISCFDVILNNQVTKKGAVLTQMSKFWFDMTEDILPNHMISVDVKDMPEFFQQERFDGNSMMCRKLEMLPIECIVRGYITGSGWASYQKDGTVCGITLPQGLKSLISSQSPFIRPLPKRRSATTTRISPLSRALTIWKNTSPAREKNTPKSFGTAPSPCTKSAPSTPSPEESLSRTPV